MNDKLFHITPYLPDRTSDLQDQAVDVFQKSAALCGKLHPITLNGLIDLLRITNTYYSNLIEDHNTHPIDIERAMAQQYDKDPTKRNLQIEAKVHVELERELDTQIVSGDIKPAESSFICDIHNRFYKNLPEQLTFLPEIDGNSSVRVLPGTYRNRYVQVSRLIPAAPHDIPMYMNEFSRHYDLDHYSRIDKLLAIAAAHHRLIWIHPFLDGNGRVARLFTGVCIKMAGVSGYGVWSINRGFARNKIDYMAALAAADAHRQGDLDDRGYLTQKGLNQFCTFFLKTCLDQISFMETLLDLDGLLSRIEQYIRLRSQNLIPGIGPIRSETFYLIKEAFTVGEFARGQAARLTGLKERTARSLLSDLVSEELLVSDTPKGPVRLKFSTRLLPVWFPDLVPDK